MEITKIKELCKTKLSNKIILNEKINPDILSSTQRALTPEAKRRGDL